MADKFSLEDIVAEYSNKTVGGKDDDASVDDIISEANTEIGVADSNDSELESIFTASETAQEISDSYKQEAVIEEPVVDEVESAEELEVEAVEASAELTDDTAEDDDSYETAQDNAQMIENLMKKKVQEGEVHQNSDETPVSRKSVKDIDLGLDGKIIPKTEELEKIVPDIPQDATYEEKTHLLSQRRKKKIEGFMLNTDDENSKKEEKAEKSYGQSEFESFDKAAKIRDDILQVKNNLFMRMCVLMFTGVFSLLITIANDFELPLVKIFDKTMSPSAFLFTNTILGIISIAISYTVLAEGMKNLFKRRADCDSIAALGIFISVITGIVTLFEPTVVRESFYNVYTSAAIFGLLFNTMGKLMIVKRTQRNFNFVAGDYERYALVNVTDEDTVGKLTRGAVGDFPELATMKKTEFVNDFMKNSYSADIADSYARKMTPYILLAGLFVGVISLFFEKGATGAQEKIFTLMSVMSGTIAICSSLALMLVVNVPLGRAHKKYLQYSGVMLGYSSVEDFAETNSVLVDAEQLFPNGMVDFVNLKLLSTTRVEDCILMAASLACQAGSVLRPTFYKMLRGKTEMLYPVESYIYEEGLGLSGWIENKRVLLGTRELMEHHSIQGIPTHTKEIEYAKGNTVLYLSVSGVVTTLFVVQINASLSVTRWMQELEEENIVPVIRTVDGFINERILSDLFGIAPESIKMLPFRFYKDYEKETEFVPSVSSSMLCSGHFPSFAMLIIGAKRLKFISTLGVALQMGAAALGGILVVIMMLVGSFSLITPSLVICYNLILVVVTLLVQHIKRL